MKALLGLFACALALATPPRTLRVDWYHTGNQKQELFSLDRVVAEPLPWPGPPERQVDDTELGKYRFEVYDPASRKVLYSRGFCSIYGEWETTEEAARMTRTFSESLRFPDPGQPVRIRLQKRDPKNAWMEIWDFALDPRDKFVDTSRPASPGPLVALERNGEPAHKVDLLVLGDGYTAAQRSKFERDARRCMEQLFAQEPFKARRKDFNVWGLCPPAQEVGVSRPSTGIHRRSPLGCTYDAFDSERYLLTFENRTFRDIASFAPYEYVLVLTNTETYGGGGIFGLYGTVAADNRNAPYIFVHEFGHHFAGLADEYYTSDPIYQPSATRIEPWELNVTADPQSPKWKALLSPGVPLPTPWKKADFEAHSHAIQKERKAIRAANRPEADMDALFERQKTFETKLLGEDVHSRHIGSFEGANYEATGYFRSQTDCIMFTRDPVPFCAACQAAIGKVIDLYTRK